MSTNQSLPAGFSITSIGGKRCTAVPRTNARQSSAIQSSAIRPSATQIASNVPAAVEPTVAQNTPTPVPVAVVPSTQSQPQTTAPSIAIPASTSDVEAIAPAVSTPQATLTPIVSSTRIPVTSIPFPLVTSSTSASPSLAAILTTFTGSSSAPFAPAQSELSEVLSFSTISRGIDSENTPKPATTTSTPKPITTPPHPAESSDTAVVFAPRLSINVGAIVGAVVGLLALVAMIICVLWFCRRKRRRNSDSLLPFVTGTQDQFYEIDNDSVGPTKRSKVWKHEVTYQVQTAASKLKEGVVSVGASLKTRVAGDRNDTPSVNLNRGNSQFIHGPIPQHSRNNSSIVSNNTSKASVKDKFKDWWERFTEVCRLQKKSHEMVGPFASAGSMPEKQMHSTPHTDFSQLLNMDKKESHLQAERRRSSLTGSLTLPKLSLDTSIEDPFADPHQNNPWRPPNTINPNPFADPIHVPPPIIPKSQTYTPASVRRSNRYSTFLVVKPTTTLNLNSPRVSEHRSPSATSRYPSTIAPSHDSYRDTIISSFSGGRKGKGRSDPFDLERPELWKPRDRNAGPPSSHQNGGLSQKQDANKNLGQNSGVIGNTMYDNRGQERSNSDAERYMYSNPLRMNSEQQHLASHYSSGVSSLAEWGDPGPDLGAGSTGTSIRGEASTSRENILQSENGGRGNGVYLVGNEAIKGSLAEIRTGLNDGNGVKQEVERRREMHNVRPVSALGVQEVGKAV